MEEQKTIQELIADTERAFQNFIYLIYYTNPLKDNIRVILDDGEIKVYLKRERFLKMIEDSMDLNDSIQKNNYIFIKQSIYSYGKWYLYDRSTNTVRDLIENVDWEHIRPKDLFDETRSNITNKDEKRFEAISKQYEDITNIKDEKGMLPNLSKRMFATIRNFSNKKRKNI